MGIEYILANTLSHKVWYKTSVVKIISSTMELSDSDFSDAGEDHERETKKN